VTGASRGIGAAIAHELAAAGARVALNYRASAETAERLAAEIDGVAIGGDIGDRDEAAAVVARAEEAVGDLDILVNNAGITRDTLIARMSDDDWETVLATNLSGAFYTSRAVARKMLRRRAGAIVNLTSFVGLHGNAGQANYAATKAGLIGLTKALAKELGTRGVRVNAVAPGYITTDITSGLSDELRHGILTLTPLGRLGDPADVARAVRFLCSDEAAYVTGEVLRVDGGLGM